MKHIPSIIAFILVSLFGGALIASAQSYTPLAPLPGTIDQASGTTNISSYVAGMIKLLVALGAALAVLFAIIGGTQYVAAGISPDAKSGAKERIVRAITGLTIILSSYLLLNSINPDLVNFKLELPSVVVRNWVQSTGPGDVVDPTGCPNITSPSTLLDSPEALSMEASGGTSVIFSSDDSVVQTNLSRLKTESNHLIGALAQVGISARVTSAYRPYSYQKHLYQIYDAWVVKKLKDNNDPVCATIKATVGAEYSKHGLGSLVSNPDTQNSPHMVGTGVDIKLDFGSTGATFNDFSSLGNTHWHDINSFMVYEGIKLNWQGIPGDEVHFNLR